MPPPPYPGPLTTAGHVEPMPRRVRAWAGDTLVLDTTDGAYVWEHPFYPQYVFPAAAMQGAQLTASGLTKSTPLGEADVFDVTIDGRTLTGAAWRIPDDSIAADVAGWFRLEWAAFDRWAEEDEDVIVHPRSPYVRIDCLPSSRTVRVELAGRLLAESSDVVMLFETGLVTRYYFPEGDVDLDALVDTPLRTSCPYKGTVSDYWDAQVGDRQYRRIAWRYADTFPEVAPIAGRIAFHNEKVDIYVDGE